MRKLCFILMLAAPLAGAADDWGPAQFLVGKWAGEGTGQPGSGSGSFSLLPDLQGKVLIRKSFAEYPAAGGRPATRHDDLMIVYRQPQSGALRAMYYDSEGHVIAYAVKAVEGGVAFTSDNPADQTRYRLTYTAAGKDRTRIKFEIAPPGQEFAQYLEATVRRE
jgi:hypothetical protein